MGSDHILLKITLILTTVDHMFAQSWSKVPSSSSTTKEVSGRMHNDIWVTNTDYSVYHWENNAFVNKPGSCFSVSGSFQTGRSWCIGINKTPYRFDGNTWVQFNLTTTNLISKISAKSYSTAIGITEAGNLLRYDEGIGETPAYVSSLFTKKQCSIGIDDTVWCIDTNRNIWRWSCNKKDFIQVVGGGDYVDVHDATRVLVTNSQTQEVFIYMIGNKNWGDERKKLSGGCVQASISDSYVYCTAADNTLWWAPYPLNSLNA